MYKARFIRLRNLPTLFFIPDALDAVNKSMDQKRFDFIKCYDAGKQCNYIHLYNYFRIAADNPGTEFALWTKNVAIYQAGLKLFGYKPENIIVGFSPIHMNVIPSEKSLIAAKNSGFDFIFGVNDTYANQEKSLMNGGHKCKCGENSCGLTCQFCYSAARRQELGYNMAASNKAVFISEILDGERHKE